MRWEALDLRRDQGARAAAYLTVLGWVNLAGLNLGGVLWLWLASKIRARSNGGRRWAIGLLGLQVLLLGVVLGKVLLDPGSPPQVMFYGAGIGVHPAVVVVIGVGSVAVLIVPLVWLLAPGTRARFERREERGLCVGCGYDLRETTGVCPECGMAVPAVHRTAREVEEVFGRIK
jgi:hypothetical protein